MSQLGRIYYPGETMPVEECRYCGGTGTLKNVVYDHWSVPKLIKVRCTHKVGDPYGFALEPKRDCITAWLVLGTIAAVAALAAYLIGVLGQ